MSEKIIPAAPAARAETGQNSQALVHLLRRLHFYIGLFIGPFIFIAALTGTLYVLTPQLENHLYAQQLFTPSTGEDRPLSQQVSRAIDYLGSDAQIVAVRPAPASGETTRVMFRDAQAAASETHAVFVDPKTLAIRGELRVYGTSGVLPFRTWLDYLHRNLLLGDIGRNYSELAASWLWIAALGGVALWAFSRTPRRTASARRQSKSARFLRQRHWHTTLGLVLLLGLVFFSATGLTWSNWAGNNIAQMRAHFGWLTPAVNTTLGGGQPMMPMDEHAEHHAGHMAMMAHQAAATTVTPAQFDAVLASAREANIDAGKVEIRPAYSADKAWVVSEIDRSWPTQVDAVSINPHNFQLVDKVEFAQFGLLAKLTRWGVDAHMGVLFGVANQLLLALFGIGLCVMTVLGYRMWWLRRPAIKQQANPADTLIYGWRKLSLSLRFLLAVIGVALAFSLPLMGISLLLFLLIDGLRWYKSARS
ncbi:PepSY domain-containing protein [Erwiniaceae bacterium BAC15a-03b]|uniref:PepSY domain-containing protein n=1 Tax=Winslowiella arboricola TaxID=2978220 RepID=A0A9J6PLW4_9GAMM|nr:PepSY-associated TM helix domain-containing protein [Winslowiella arboricola]MCU5771937.1 PepSY domain-containing protein [Winslowiella arboricola]MCU5778370.1 PepSY domain-containing protein [Winslowiella arboricola]